MTAFDLVFSAVGSRDHWILSRTHFAINAYLTDNFDSRSCESSSVTNQKTRMTNVHQQRSIRTVRSYALRGLAIDLQSNFCNQNLWYMNVLRRGVNK